MTTSRRRRDRGLSLTEIMIAVLLAGLVSAAILMLARGQLRAHEMNDQLMRAQANVRAGVDYAESIMRRACGGVSQGRVGISVGVGVTQQIVPCLHVFDGATTSGGSFNSGVGASAADAIEVIYPVSSPTVLTIAPDLDTTPTLTVANATGISQNDFVLVADNNGGILLKVAGVAGNVITCNPVGTAASSYVPSEATLQAGSSVFRAMSVALFAGSALNPSKAEYAGALLLDPDGVAGATHDDAEPLIDFVDDFQVAVGVDGANGGVTEGTLTEQATPSQNGDEWIGNYAGETVPAPPWTATGIHPALIRATILVRTVNNYPGGTTTWAIEDRSQTLSGTAQPRWRPSTIVVAPRAWNLAN